MWCTLRRVIYECFFFLYDRAVLLLLFFKKKNQSELQASKLARTEHRASPATKRRRRSGEAEHAADETRPARDTLVLVVRLGEANQIPVTRAFGSTSPPWGQELGHRRRDPRHATTEAAAALLLCIFMLKMSQLKCCGYIKTYKLSKPANAVLSPRASHEQWRGQCAR